MQIVEHDECLLWSLFSFSLLFFATRNYRWGLYHRVRCAADDLTAVVAPSWTPPRIGALLRAAVWQITSILRAGLHSPSVRRSPVPLPGMKGKGDCDRPWTRSSPLRPASKKTGSSKLPCVSHYTVLSVAHSDVARTPEARLCRGKIHFRPQQASRRPHWRITISNVLSTSVHYHQMMQMMLLLVYPWRQMTERVQLKFCVPIVRCLFPAEVTDPYHRFSQKLNGSELNILVSANTYIHLHTICIHIYTFCKNQCDEYFWEKVKDRFVVDNQ